MIKRAKYLAMERPETWKKYTNLHIIIMSHNISFTTYNIINEDEYASIDLYQYVHIWNVFDRVLMSHKT